MSSTDDQPVIKIKPRIDYNVYVEDLRMPIHVTCDDIAEKDGYVRFMDGDIPAAIIPVGRFVGVSRRLAPKESDQ